MKEDLIGRLRAESKAATAHLDGVPGVVAGGIRHLAALIDEAAEALSTPPEGRDIDCLIGKLRALHRFDCSGAEGDYDAGMVPGEGYVDFYAMEKLLDDFQCGPQQHSSKGEKDVG